MDGLSRLIASTDPLRGPPAGAGAPYKEWLHFCVVTKGLRLLVNFSVAADLRPAAAPGARLGRLVLLAAEDRWQGGVDTFADDAIRAWPGAIDLALGESRVHFAGGAFRVAARLARGDLAARLELRPSAVPLVGLDADLGGGTLSWVVVPALRARGVVVVSGRRHELADAPAYHDHNWGAWRWGQDFAWQWGFALPSAPSGPQYSVVLSRLTDRARTRDLDVKLCLWEGDHLVRVFHGRDLTLTPEGSVQDRPVASFPPVMALLVPGAASDAPRRLFARAARGEDELRCRFDTGAATRILIPNEADAGVTAIHELATSARIEGRVRGREINMDAEGILEHLEIY